MKKEYMHLRISPNVKTAFGKYAEKKKTTMSELLTKHIESLIKK